MKPMGLLLEKKGPLDAGQTVHPTLTAFEMLTHILPTFFLPHQGIQVSLGRPCVLIPLCLWVDCFYSKEGCLFLPVSLGGKHNFSGPGSDPAFSVKTLPSLAPVGLSLCERMAPCIFCWVVYMFSHMPKIMSFLRVGTVSTFCFSMGLVSKRSQKFFDLVWFEKPGWDLLLAQLRCRVDLGEFSDEMLD